MCGGGREQLKRGAPEKETRTYPFQEDERGQIVFDTDALRAMYEYYERGTARPPYIGAFPMKQLPTLSIRSIGSSVRQLVVPPTATSSGSSCCAHSAGVAH